jgi:hypothetical protein
VLFRSGICRIAPENRPYQERKKKYALQGIKDKNNTDGKAYGQKNTGEADQAG